MLNKVKTICGHNVYLYFLGYPTLGGGGEGGVDARVLNNCPTYFLITLLLSKFHIYIYIYIYIYKPHILIIIHHFILLHTLYYN
jgi:hypothetical protein